MGNKFAPNYAYLFMAKWEQEALSKYPKQPQFNLRYLDDIFIIGPTEEKILTTSFKFLTPTNPTSL